MIRLLVLAVLLAPMVCCAEEGPVRRLSVKEYVGRMKAGWVGQMVGVGWGFPTEFKFNGKIIPPDKMPAWRPETVNQFQQDDLYVEMTFLRTLELHGLGCTTRQAGIDFANSGYPLWHANKAGRENLRAGIAPPGSGHPKFSKHSDDIDYQIEADFSGLIAPGLPQTAIDLGEKFGRLMNYGDGLYGGQFVGGMYAEAFFTDDLHQIILAGLSCIPKESQYAEMIRDVLAWHKAEPTDWQATWQKIEAKYHNNPKYSHGLCCGHGADGHFCIDAKLNGAYILVGMLYGERDPEKTVVLATRCGQDSDCNPSNAAGILFTTMGYGKLPEQYTSALDWNTKFSHTPYTMTDLVKVSEQLARAAVLNSGGRVERLASGEEVFVIPRTAPKPSKPEKSYAPGPIGESRFTAEEMAKIPPPAQP